MSLVDTRSYRPEIDGLRAIAVLAVLLFHFDFGLPSGFLGVDIFFVVSGFLITSLIQTDIEAGRFTLRAFWERRARRILPVLMVLMIVTMAAGWFILLPLDFARLAKSCIAQCLFASNLYFWHSGGYFGGSSEKPLLHTWSLSVEEQFYALAPLVLASLSRSKFSSRKSMLVSLYVALALSLGANFVGSRVDASGAFYFLPSRAWELIAGALAFFLPQSNTMKQSYLEGVSILALIAILSPLFVSPQPALSPLMALVTCVGTATLLWIGKPPDKSGGIVAAVLSLPALRFIGLISYSLYLWHWPLLAFAVYVSFEPLSDLHRSVLIGIALGLSVLSWKFIESPFRERKIAPDARSLIVAVTAVATLLAGGSCAILAAGGIPQRFSTAGQKYSEVMTEAPTVEYASLDQVREGKLPAIGSSALHPTPTVLVWGDSHAMAALPAVNQFLAESGRSGYAAIRSETPPVLQTEKPAGQSETGRFNDEVLKFIQKNQIKEVLLIAHWSVYAHRNADAAAFADRLARTVKQLQKEGAQAWLLLDVPEHSFEVPRALVYGVSKDRLKELCAQDTVDQEMREENRNLITTVLKAGGRVLNPLPQFLAPGEKYYVIEANDRSLYADSHHLSTRGATLMLLPLLRQSLKLSSPSEPDSR